VPTAKPKPKPAPRAVQPADNPPYPPPTDATAVPAAPTNEAPKPAPKPRQPSTPANVVNCSGLFAKDASHVKLATFFQTQNSAYGQVGGSGGGALNATILFPKDPKRRLEVLWQNEAGRSDIATIAITGQSQWKGPKGLHLGLALAALEKLNGKPFKLS